MSDFTSKSERHLAHIVNLSVPERHVKCDFDTNDFLCGYEIQQFQRYRLTRQKVNRLNKQQQPVVDSDDSEIGYFVFANPSGSKAYDKAYIKSPDFKVTESSLLSFYTYISTSDGDKVSAINCYLISLQTGQREVSCGKVDDFSYKHQPCVSRGSRVFLLRLTQISTQRLTHICLLR